MASVSEVSLRFARIVRASSTRFTLMSHLGDSGIVKMVPISVSERASGIPRGILQEAEMFGPDLICDAPRLIHDSRVYPNLHFYEQEFGDAK